jgi:hypothetical protein
VITARPRLDTHVARGSFDVEARIDDRDDRGVVDDVVPADRAIVEDRDDDVRVLGRDQPVCIWKPVDDVAARRVECDGLVAYPGDDRRAVIGEAVVLEHVGCRRAEGQPADRSAAAEPPLNDRGLTLETPGHLGEPRTVGADDDPADVTLLGVETGVELLAGRHIVCCQPGPFGAQDRPKRFGIGGVAAPADGV